MPTYLKEVYQLKILGINAYHADSAACLLVDGKVVAAAEEERFLRIKHWAGFPRHSIEFCLKHQGITLDEVDVVAVNTDPKASRYKRLKYVLASKPSVGLILEKIRIRKRRESIKESLESALASRPYNGTIFHVEHHVAHLASAFLVSPFQSATMLSVDGFGDFCSSAWGLGERGNVQIDGRVYFPHSLGVFYQAMTQYLGFPNYGDEYKVMGLASYGRGLYKETVSSLVSQDSQHCFRLDLKFFRHHRERIGYEWEDGAPGVNVLYTKEVEELLGPRRLPSEPITQRHKDLAFSTQAVFEDRVFTLLNGLHKDYGSDKLVMSGGCAMNSVANGKVYKRTPFRHLFVPAAAGDAGGAVGAAIIANTRIGSEIGRPHMSHAYIGPGFLDSEVEKIIDCESLALDEADCIVNKIGEQVALLNRVVKALLAGKVVGWFQGRMEWGPRALGNRSILCDPRRNDIKEILNSKIKRRESFRPFAPSILREAVSDWFIQDDDVPFMEKVFEVNPAKKDLIPAVAHVDGTGRLQTVEREANPRFYDLIKTFETFTKVPIVLNTSFNENEPIVCRPREALDCFLRTKMDMLVLGDYVVERK
ncbi:carbamoyltransferase [Pseudomonadota bacterium]